MEYLHSLLKFAINMGASDIHVKPEHHATIRISGELFPVQVDPPTKEQVAEIVQHMLPKHLEARLEREKEADFSYIDGALGRFRVNVFYQRGVLAFAMRHVKMQVPAFKDLNLPDTLAKIAKAERGIILVTGPTGCGKSSTSTRPKSAMSSRSKIPSNIFLKISNRSLNNVKLVSIP